MSGGPSQLDTFDPKPDHANGGPIRPIETSVPGIHIGQHLSRVARKMEHMAVIRSMSTKEGDHGPRRSCSAPDMPPRGRSTTRLSGRWSPRSLGARTTSYRAL